MQIIGLRERSSQRSVVPLICILLSYTLSVSVHARTYYVAEITDADLGTQASPFDAIQKAADVVRPGDIVLVKGGVYEESVTLKTSGTESHPIIFRPQPDTGAIILRHPAEDQETKGVFTLRDISFVHIEGFRFSDFKYGWAIHMSSSQHDHTVLPHKAQGNVIRNNTFENMA